MSYCRWSTDNHRSDVYVYEHCTGSFQIHVAGARWPDGAPSGKAEWPPPSPSEKDRLNSWATQMVADKEAWSAWADANPPVAWEHPESGKSYYLGSPRECADKLATLADSGVRVPEGVIEALRAEQCDDYSQESQSESDT